MYKSSSPWLILLLLALLVAACQPVQPVAPDEPPTVTFTATEYAYSGPDAISGGLTRIEFVNAGEQEHTLWLVKLDEGKTFDDLMTVFMALETNPAFPAWMVWYGGVSAPGGGDAAYIVDLAPGTYTLFSFSENEEGIPDAAQGMVKTLEVGAATGDAMPPAADLRVELIDFSFVIHGTPRSGEQIVEIANTGIEPHELILLKLDNDATMTEVMDFMMAGEEASGVPPFEFYGGAGPIGGGMRAWYEVDVPAGNYGLICFVPSPMNEGAPHFALGMVQQIRLDGDDTAAISQPMEPEILTIERTVALPFAPHDIAADAAGNLYAVNLEDEMVYKLDANGAVLAAWGGSGSDEGLFAFRPLPGGPPLDGGFVTVDENGHIYISDFNNRVQKFDGDGNLIDVWSSGADGAPFNLPGPVSADLQGHVYVGDFAGVHQFTTGGEFVRLLPGAGEVAIDSAGNYYLPIAFENKVLKANTAGEVLLAWGEAGDAPGHFDFPMLAVMDGEDHVLVADHSGRIQKFDGDGNYLGSWQLPAHDGAQGRTLPEITVSPNGELLVAAKDRPLLYVLVSHDSAAHN